MFGRYNRIELLGHLAGAPKKFSTKGGASGYDVSIAVNRRGKKGDDSEPQWWSLIFWDDRDGGNRFEKVLPYLEKGTKVLVEGEATARAWSDQKGDPRVALSCSVGQLALLGSKQSDANDDERPARSKSSTADDLDDEVPF
jgi:single-strand DNA-binding protein